MIWVRCETRSTVLPDDQEEGSSRPVPEAGLSARVPLDAAPLQKVMSQRKEEAPDPRD
jgi:hypothetical protein